MAYSADPADRLAEVRAAIQRCLTSQEYQTAHGRRQRMAELRELRAMEKDLQQEAAAEASGGGGIVYGQLETNP
jgi:hypothetical protein